MRVCLIHRRMVRVPEEQSVCKCPAGDCTHYTIEMCMGCLPPQPPSSPPNKEAKPHS